MFNRKNEDILTWVDGAYKEHVSKTCQPLFDSSYDGKFFKIVKPSNV